MDPSQPLISYQEHDVSSDDVIVDSGEEEEEEGEGREQEEKQVARMAER